ncbi:MAG: DEAD/DEAH box helicase [Bacillati bacterium]
MTWDLRECQRIPLTDWAHRRPKDFLAVITPGGGKTRLAAAIAVGSINGGLARRIGIVVPTTALKLQWAEEFALANLRIDTRWIGKALPPHSNGVVITYAQLASNPLAYSQLVDGGLSIHDEIHHAGVQGSWGAALEQATQRTRHRLHLSGTPFRTDKHRIAHLAYQRHTIVADYVYSYRDALRDRIVRPVVCYPQSGHITWRSASGQVHDAELVASNLSASAASERLRLILEDEGWLAETLTRANEILKRLRNTTPDAGALAVAMNQTHANQLASLIVRILGVKPTVVISDDEEADDHLKRFKNSTEPK